jgi:hypothetical protein
MNKYRTKFLIAMELCAIVLLTSFAAAPASAETAAAAPAKETVTFQSGVDDVTPPQVPDNIKVEDGFVPFLVGHADGTQNYVCRPAGAGFAYALFTPEATLFNGHDKQLITHYFSPNPEEANTDPRVDGNLMIRATWQHLDTSTIWAKVHQQPTGVAIVDPDSVAWLLLDVVGHLVGPNGGATLFPAQFVQRVNTVGGNPPKEGCSSLADVGKEAFVHYNADYFFWKKADQ